MENPTRVVIDHDNATTHYRTCPLCEATCGLEVTVEDTTVVRIRGDQDDVFSKGFLCPKGTALKGLHHDPDRLRQPMIRRGEVGAEDAFEEVTWDEAFAEVERLVTEVTDAHGRASFGAYAGNPNAHSHGNGLFLSSALKAMGTRHLYSASTVDQMPKHVSSALMFGLPSMMPVPDVDRTDLLVMAGANPWASNGSLATAPDFPGRIKAVQERGGKVVVIDPRRSRTAEEADQHLFIRPGTDSHLFCAILRTLISEGLTDVGRLGDTLNGVDQIEALVEPFTPELVAGITGIDADTIVGLARDIAAANSAAVYGRIGVHTTRFGTISAWAVDVIAALTANLDEPGGHMWPLAPHARRESTKPGGRGFSLGRWSSRVRELPEALGELPVATMADEMLTEGEGQLRALVTFAGNPARTTPDTDRLEQGLAGLDAMISVDPYLNETTKFANVILPPPTQLERSQYDMAFYGLSVRNIANYSPPLFAPEGPSEVEILSRLALIFSGQGDADTGVIAQLMIDGFLSKEIARAGSPIEGRDQAEIEAMLDGDSGEDRLLDAMLRTGPYGEGFGADPDGLSLQKLIDNPHGIDLGALQPRLPNMLKTASGKVELAPETIVADIARLRTDLEAASANGTATSGDGGLLLVGRRHLRSNNSWMHNVEVLVKGKERCTLQLHPDDAANLGLTDGQSARVASASGAVVAPVEVTDSVMAGVVSLPHGWGHDVDGIAMAVAEAHPGANSNVLTDASPLDAPSGNAVLNGIPVTVGAA